MSAAFHFLEVLVVSVVALVALILVLIVVVAHLPGSPMKEILAALARRIGATAPRGAPRADSRSRCAL
jgi:ABC-type microcin C transport system permease subunit YejB